MENWILLSKFIISNGEWWQRHRKVEWLSSDALLNLCLNAIFHLRFVAINSEFGISVCRLIFKIYLSIQKLNLICLSFPVLTELYAAINSQLVLLFSVFIQQFLLFRFCVCYFIFSKLRHRQFYPPWSALLYLCSNTTFDTLKFFFTSNIFSRYLFMEQKEKKRFFLFTHVKQSRTYVHHFSWMETVVSSSNRT